MNAKQPAPAAARLFQAGNSPARDTFPCQDLREKEDLDFWLALFLTPGVGPGSFHLLRRVFGTAEAVFGAGEHALRRVRPRIPEPVLHSLLRGPNREAVARQRELCLGLGVEMLPLWDERFPVPLRRLDSPPPLLYMRGSLLPADARSVAVVGPRSPSAYGRVAAWDMATHLARSGYAIVSGLARGVDTRAHEAALSAGQRTLAVAGVGLDTVYPQENRRLFERIVENGAVLSEFPFGTPIRAGNFPRRNRYIAGLSLATLVVEAGEDSGALITADLAGRQGKPVFAIPGSIYSATARGAHVLLRRGAHLVSRPEEVSDFLASCPAPAPKPLLPGGRSGLPPAAQEFGPEETDASKRRFPRGQGGGGKASPPVSVVDGPGIAAGGLGPLLSGSGTTAFKGERNRRGRFRGQGLFAQKLDPRERSLCELLREGPLEIDQLTAALREVPAWRTGFSLAAVLGVLLRLELQGRVGKRGNARFGLE